MLTEEDLEQWPCDNLPVSPRPSSRGRLVLVSAGHSSHTIHHSSSRNALQIRTMAGSICALAGSTQSFFQLFIRIHLSNKNFHLLDIIPYLCYFVLQIYPIPQPRSFKKEEFKDEYNGANETVCPYLCIILTKLKILNSAFYLK